MARVFISHSSRDVEVTSRIKSWLELQGFERLFLDFDKHIGIPPGADWERTLYREISRAHAVILIVTSNWQASKWCWSEFTQARALGKAIFPIIEAPTGEVYVAPNLQQVDLTKDRTGGLQQLARALDQLAREQQDFSWDSHRPPFPGLLAFEEEDAAIYFGRDDDIRHLIERLNTRRALGGAKLIALCGASGSGKSSLLRAGIIPRLRRDKRNWIVLPTFRPQLYPIDEFARALSIASHGIYDWRTCRGWLEDAYCVKALSDFAQDVRMQLKAPEAEVLISVDQAEELFGVSDSHQAIKFLQLLSELLEEMTPYFAIFTLRADYLDQLLKADALRVAIEEVSLKPMMLARIPEIIDGPAKVCGFSVDRAIPLRAAEDTKTGEALPLLALTLHRLYERYGRASGSLRLEDYQCLGDAAHGLNPVENAIRDAADSVLVQAKPSAQAIGDLRQAFIPTMVGIDDSGEYVRRPARWDHLPAGSHELVLRLANARLLIIRQEGEHRIVEIAHDALLRKWPMLLDWLNADREFLIWRSRFGLILRKFSTASRWQKRKILLDGFPLQEAVRFQSVHRRRLSAEENLFIERSRHRAIERKIVEIFILAASFVAAMTLKLYLAVEEIFDVYGSVDNPLAETISPLFGRQMSPTLSAITTAVIIMGIFFLPMRKIYHTIR
jgi:hypothetical protein